MTTCSTVLPNLTYCGQFWFSLGWVRTDPIGGIKICLIGTLFIFPIVAKRDPNFSNLRRQLLLRRKKSVRHFGQQHLEGRSAQLGRNVCPLPREADRRRRDRSFRNPYHACKSRLIIFTTLVVVMGLKVRSVDALSSCNLGTLIGKLVKFILIYCDNDIWSIFFLSLQARSISDQPITNEWAPILLAAIFAYVTSHCFISVYGVRPNPTQ